MKQFIYSSIVFSFLFLAGCKNEHENHQEASDSYYTCPMHPTVINSTPGTCPVCNMSLIKVEKKENDHAGHEGNFITIDKRRQELAGIETDTIKFRNIYPASTVVGTVAIDEVQVKTISSRVKGRIDKLFVKTTGVYLKSGIPLYSIYSEQLLADEKEYLTLHKKNKTINSTTHLTNEFLNAAKSKLLLWGLTEKQISELVSSGNASPLITFYSPEAGYVTEVKITEGVYVEEGSLLIKITSLNHVWVEAQVYSNELSKNTDNKSFLVYSENNPDEVYKGVLAYNNPVIEEGRRVQLLRIRVDNIKGNLIPGMMVSISPQKTTQPVLAVPKSAVLLEKMKTAWVLAHDNTFEQRMVETGVENKYWIEILSGLKQGDIVVTEGAYLISSEFILKSGAGQRHEH
ncbi:MAG: efflux RND transporter periplasmic adaptor subunit [Chitinophagales bacterium]|nr:efflux RND transporter periplasmic adaptor subunit [Chitinophagales bacterium]